MSIPAIASRGAPSLRTKHRIRLFIRNMGGKQQQHLQIRGRHVDNRFIGAQKRSQRPGEKQPDEHQNQGDSQGKKPLPGRRSRQSPGG